ncbi:UDP-GlcNAc:undecaprenyl-phosphate GlcNAc-1-phosphate transferase [Arcicella aurantiaca]|uniref:UDP-GlcNAc:undecaprenyl-phosphate GlcNAc-1-phosphate transferase n=1 Tax=Arcicella aurantiaca TaxID=591202 RepID=A0A316DUE5_9BACT|nr:MraY family glycosyltransferase [Arcicella aurantiaca]PWK21426.1 UDP-GlcNAc:undecaprenyl-phosphate GlcNAc-1-phosphate transferase [Arcicella aurantiaca]
MTELYSIIIIISVLIFISLCTSYGVNNFFLKNASSFGKNKGGSQIRWASASKPPLGGMSFYAVFILLMILISSLAYFNILKWDSNYLMVGLLLPMTIGFFVGLADDSYNTSPLVKFVGQFVCGLFFMLSENLIHICNIDWVNNWFTIVWVVGMMNSINMLDNMDGVVTGVSLTSLLVALMIMIKLERLNLVDVILIIGTIGALIGFLFFNWHPAKIYMGDTGSQFLGAFLAWVSIQYFWIFRDETTGGFQAHQFLVPALAFIVSLIDTTTVTIRRLARGVSPFVGGRDHTTHHFAYLGMSDKNVVRILIGVSSLSALVIFIMLDDLILNHWSFYKTLGVIFFYISIFAIIQYYYEMAKQKIGKGTMNKQSVLIVEKMDDFD